MNYPHMETSGSNQLPAWNTSPRREIFMSEAGSNSIQRFTSSGAFVSSREQRVSALIRFKTTKRIICDALGHLFLLGAGNKRVVVLVETFFHDVFALGASGESGTALGRFRVPVNLCSRPQGVCVADASNHRVHFFDPAESGEGREPTPLNPRFAVSGGVGLVESVGQVISSRVA